MEQVDPPFESNDWNVFGLADKIQQVLPWVRLLLPR
jgi:hypothetical protein